MGWIRCTTRGVSARGHSSAAKVRGVRLPPLTEPMTAALAWTEKVLARTRRRGTSGPVHVVHVAHREYWAELSGRALALLDNGLAQAPTLLTALEELRQLVDNIDEGIARWGSAPADPAARRVCKRPAGDAPLSRWAPTPRA